MGQVTLRDIDWSDSLAAHLALMPEPRQPEDWYFDRFTTGEFRAIGLFDEGDHVASLVYRSEVTPFGNLEFVVVATAGNWSRGSVIGSAWPVVEGMARDAGFDTARLHTSRPGMVKVMRAMGFHRAEIVMRKGLH